MLVLHFPDMGALVFKPARTSVVSGCQKCWYAAPWPDLSVT